MPEAVEPPNDPLSHAAEQAQPVAATPSMRGAAAEPEAVLLTEEPPALGTSTKLTGRAFSRYMLLYSFAALGIFAIWGAIGGILLPNQVQGIEFTRFFIGPDAAVNLADLQNLKTQVETGAVQATGEQQRLLGLLAQFDAARAQGLATVTAFGVFVTMFVQPIAGVLSDRTRSPWGRRAPWIAGGAVLGALLLIALRYSNTIVFMAIFWALAQLIINVAQGPLTTTVADRVPQEKIGTASAISGLGLMLGAILGSVAAGILFGQLGLDAYYPFAVSLAVLPVLFVLIARDQSSQDLTVEPLHWGKFFGSFLIPLRDADYRWVWIAKIVMMFGYTVSTAFSFYMLQGYVRPALSPAEATATAPLLGLVGLPGMLVAMVVAGRWSDRIKRRKPFVFWTSILMAASFVIPLVSPTLPALFAQAILGSLAMGAYMVVDQALFIDVIEDKRTAGRDLGMSSLGGNFGQAIGPIVAGQVVALTGGYLAVWIVAAVIVLVAAFAIIPVKRVA